MKPLFTVTNNIFILFILGLVIVTSFTSLDIFFPSLPAVSKTFSVTDGMSQWTIATYLLGFSVSQLLYGPLSDQWGRRPVLLLGGMIFVIGSIGCIIANSIEGTIAARFIQGFGGGAGATLGRVILRDMFVGKQFATTSSILTIGMGLVFAVAPALGGVIQEHFDFHGNFIYMLGSGIVALVLLALFMPETNNSRAPHRGFRNVAQNYLAVMKNKDFMIFTVIASLSLSVIIAYSIINPFLLQDELGMSAQIYGLYMIIIAGGELLGALVNVQMLKRVDITTATWFGMLCLLMAASYILLSYWLDIFTVAEIVIACTVATFSAGFVLPNASAEAFSMFEKSIGTAGAVYGFSQILIAAVVSYIIINMNSNDQLTLALVLLGLAVISLILYGYMKGHTKSKT